MKLITSVNLLNKNWNQVLLKIPVKADTWKRMFTFVPLEVAGGRGKRINKKLLDFCSQTGVQFVDLFSYLKNENDNFMNPVFTNDGLHLTGRGYITRAEVIRPLL
jgi:lysophospholipase L1-like esterase